VRLLEAREVASGASGRNGGFALRGGAMAYDIARERLGPAAAGSLWRLTEAYLERLEALAGNAFRRVGSLRLAADDGERESLRAEYDALREDGFAVDWLDELSQPLAGRYNGAILHPGDGSLQPARWVRRLGRLDAEAGADVREHTRVDSLASLEAENVVVATDGYGAWAPAGAGRRRHANPGPGRRHRAARSAALRPSALCPSLLRLLAADA
jgi:gamma-glutamylputrescine oxidase